MIGSISRGSNAAVNDNVSVKTSDSFTQKESKCFVWGEGIKWLVHWYLTNFERWSIVFDTKIKMFKMYSVKPVLKSEHNHLFHYELISYKCVLNFSIETRTHMKWFSAGMQIQACLYFQQELSFEASPPIWLWVPWMVFYLEDKLNFQLYFPFIKRISIFVWNLIFYNWKYFQDLTELTMMFPHSSQWKLLYLWVNESFVLSLTSLLKVDFDPLEIKPVIV